MCENLIDFDNTGENVSWVGVSISWEMDGIICRAIAVQPFLPSPVCKYLQIWPSAVSNLETGHLYPLRFGGEGKEGKAHQGHTATILYSLYCEVVLFLNDIESLEWLIKKKKKKRWCYLANTQ